MHTITDRGRRNPPSGRETTVLRTWTTIARHTRAIVVTAAIVASTGACGFLPAPYRMDLFETRWVVDAIGGQAIPPGTTMSFNEGGVDGIVAVNTSCGTTQMGMGGDSDGDAIDFFDPEALEAMDCSADQQATHRELFAALDSVETWSIRDDDHITLIGTSELALTRES